MHCQSLGTSAGLLPHGLPFEEPPVFLVTVVVLVVVVVVMVVVVVVVVPVEVVDAGGRVGGDGNGGGVWHVPRSTHEQSLVPSGPQPVKCRPVGSVWSRGSSPV